MLSYNLLVFYNTLYTRLNEFEKYIEPVCELGKSYNICSDTLAKTIFSYADTSQSTQSGKTTQQYFYDQKHGEEQISVFNKMTDSFKSSFDMLAFVIEFAGFKKEIVEVKEKYKFENEQYIDKLVQCIENVLSSHQAFFQATPKTVTYRVSAYQLGVAAEELAVQFSLTISFYKKIIKELSAGGELLSENENIITLQFLDVKFTYDEFLIISQAINNIYEQLKGGFGKENALPLTIIKIETGSLLEKLMGEKNIIEAIGKILNHVIDTLYRKLSVEGRLLRQTDCLTCINEALSTTAELKERGWDVSEIEQNLHGACTEISKEIYNITSTIGNRSNCIVIGGTEHSMTQLPIIPKLEVGKNSIEQTSSTLLDE